MITHGRVPPVGARDLGYSVGWPVLCIKRIIIVLCINSNYTTAHEPWTTEAGERLNRIIKKIYLPSNGRTAREARGG